MNPSLLAEETLRILSAEGCVDPLEVSDARVGLALIQLAAGKDITALGLGDAASVSSTQALQVMMRRMLTPAASHYAVLGVPRSASGSDIRENYRRLIALVHPDSRPKGLPADSAIQVNLAYAILSDPDARARYDASLSDTPARAADDVIRPHSAAAQSSPASASNGLTRFDGWVSALRARRSLVWMAALLVMPLVWVLATRSNTAPPTRLIEARPKLQVAHESPSAETRIARAESGAAISPPASVPSPGDPQPSVALAASRSLTAESERRIAATGAGTGLVLPNESMIASPSRRLEPIAVPSPGAASARQRDPLPEVPSGGAAGAGTIRPVLAASPTRDLPADRGQGVAEFLAQLADAVEAGSVDRLSSLLDDQMPGRAGVIADFENVFRSTRKRELRYLRIEQQRQSQRDSFSGVAELGLTSADGSSSTQRLFLSGTIERRGDRAKLARWSSHPVQ
jgi:curved DNA-binding protein CbpA